MNTHDTERCRPGRVAAVFEHEAAAPPGRYAPCLHEIFQRQADTTPDATAVVCGSRGLTYAELDAAANRLARRLRLSGARPGTFVGILASRSELPIIGILACLKAGAAYVPIDPGNPADRVRHIAAELDLRLCLTDTDLYPRAAEMLGADRVFPIDDPARRTDIPSSRMTHTESGVSPTDLAYVIYTSGSTGRPKGVMTEHRTREPLCRRLQQGVRHWVRRSRLPGLLAELRRAPSRRSGWPSPTAPRSWCPRPTHRGSVTSSASTSAAWGSRTSPRFRPCWPQWRLLSRACGPLVLSGEVCPPQLVSAWARRGLRILNVYGPTEATVNTTGLRMPRRRDGHDRPADRTATPSRSSTTHSVRSPTGVAGELDHRRRHPWRAGYFNEPGLTDDKFVSMT